MGPLLNNFMKVPSLLASANLINPSAVYLVFSSSVRIRLTERLLDLAEEECDSPNTGDDGGDIFNLQPDD